MFGDTDLTLGVAESSRDYPQRSGSQPLCFESERDEPRPVEYKVVETKPESEAKACEPQLHALVPKGHVFVLADNRYNANDSRIWGALPKSAIRGRVIGIWGTTALGQSMRFDRFGPMH